MTARRLPRVPYPVLLVVVFVYLLVARTHDVSESFFMLADQIRDWRIALGSWRDLPLVGTPSTAGGVSLGPIYYWILWASRVVIGPFTSNMPHAGPIGMAIVQGACDLALLHAVRRHTGNTALAVAMVLLSATSGPDLAVTATIWNPAVSVAFIKLAIALRLLRAEDASLAWSAATTAAAWLSVQAHSAAVFAAVPIVGSYAIADLFQRRWLLAFQRLRVIAEVIVLLQLPYLVHALTHPQTTAPTRALAGASAALGSGSGLRVMDSLWALMDLVTRILFMPSANAAWGMLLAGAAVVTTVRARRDLSLWAVTVAPLIVGVFGFSLWQGNYDEYWYLPIAPAGALTILLACTWWRPTWTTSAILAIVILVQPVRLNYAMTLSRMPEYGPLVRGSERIVRQTKTLRRLDTTFAMPPLSDRTFPFEILGGTFRDDAAFDAVIDANGDVQFRPARK